MSQLYDLDDLDLKIVIIDTTKRIIGKELPRLRPTTSTFDTSLQRCAAFEDGHWDGAN